jgi:anti-sigma-K factor RskA
MSDIPDEIHVLAGEYVLGALEPEEMRAVRRQAASDPRLAAAIARWELRLAPLAGAVPFATPPGALWQRIEEAIAPLPDEPADDVETLPPRLRLWQRAGLWRGTTAAALALAAGLAFIAYLPIPAAPPHIAALTAPDTPAHGFVVEARADGQMTVRPLSPSAVPSGRALELWILPRGGQKPSSLGLLPGSGRTLSISGIPQDGTQLMVSLEPAGGSTTGAPTGPVLYAGTLTRK